MVGASKILTVSYGTFSCTLEGFDDPFSTMRSIAEYFRDLAADDRYFGAEPPTPDAEMLQRIAEKEVQRRVEARVQENGLVLTQMDKPEEAAPETAAIAATVATHPAFEETDHAATEDVPDAANVAELAAPAEGATETVAEKLSRIRAVVSNTRAAEEETATADTAAFVDPSLVNADSGAEDMGFDDDATEEDIAEALSAFDEEEESTAEVAESDDEDARADTADLDEVAETESHEVAEEQPFDAPVEDVVASPNDLQHDEVAEDEPAPVEAVSDDEPEADAEEQDQAWGADDSNELDEEDDGPVGQIVKLSRDEFEAEQDAWDDAEEAAGADDEVTAEDDQGWDAFDEEDEDDFETPAEAAEIDAPVEAAQDGFADDDDFEDELSADEEDEEPQVDDALAAGIRAAIDQPEADTFDQAADHDFGAGSETRHDEMTPEQGYDEDAIAAGALAARDRLGALAEPEEEAADVDRLLEKTNSQMEESEGSRRRSAIAHLKAAVAATKADRLLKRVTSRERSEAEEQTQYRDDLAQVVRPRRPVDAGESHSERPQPIGEGASPLMLVSELRVDEGELAQAANPIRPRRIRAEDEAGAMAEAESSGYEDSAGFAEFAEKMGAKELPDLLEAAAAYAAFVENRPHFSRPQLMKRVAKCDASGEFSREAGLRSFGQLLRQGKIRKLKRGQFTVADTTRFNPEARIAGE